MAFSSSITNLAARAKLDAIEAAIESHDASLSTLTSGLSAKADASHTHSFSSLTGKPTTLAGYGITDAAASSHTHAFSSLTSVPTTLAGYGITDAASSGHTHALSALTGVTISSPTSGQVLKYNGTAWVNDTDSTGGGGSVAWADITSKPTTIAGYGITDAYTIAQTDSAIAAATAALVDSSPATLDTLNELAAALGDDANFATTVTNSLAAKAPLASPALTGTPTAPTATTGTDTTQIATTEFVQQEIAALGTVVTVSDPGANRYQIWDESTNQPALSANPAIPSNAISASDIDWNASQTHSKTLSANTTFTFSNATDGQTIVVAVTNTASNYTVTWPTVSWSGGVAPTQTTGAKTDVYTFIKVGTTIYGSAVQNF